MIYDYYNNIIFECQRIINLLENTPNQPSKCRNKINDDARGITNSQIKFKTAMLKSSLFNKADP